MCYKWVIDEELSWGDAFKHCQDLGVRILLTNQLGHVLSQAHLASVHDQSDVNFLKSHQALPPQPGSLVGDSIF